MESRCKKKFELHSLIFLMIGIGMMILLCGFSDVSDDNILPVELVIGDCDVKSYTHEDGFEFEITADCYNSSYYCLDNKDGNEIIFSFSNIDSAITWYVTISDKNGSKTYSGSSSSDVSIVVTSESDSIIELEYELCVIGESISEGNTIVDSLCGRIDIYEKK